MTSARSTTGPPEVGRRATLAYTGSTYHLPTCPRLERAAGGKVTFAARAATNRVPCAVCLPHGVRITAK